jgi:hypothetical protein
LKYLEIQALQIQALGWGGDPIVGQSPALARFRVLRGNRFGLSAHRLQQQLFAQMHQAPGCR